MSGAWALGLKRVTKSKLADYLLFKGRCYLWPGTVLESLR